MTNGKEISGAETFGRKVYSRNQVEELQRLYLENAYPSKDQKQIMADALGMEPIQVKYWFQNRRNQSKTSKERMDNQMLKLENMGLKKGNEDRKKDLAKCLCAKCGNSTAIALENIRLRDEIKRIKETLPVGPPAMDGAEP